MKGVDIVEREYTLKELSKRAELRSRRADLLRETLYLTARSCPEDLKEITKLDAEIEKITVELESM